MAGKSISQAAEVGDRGKTADGLAILRRRYYEGRPERIAALEATRANDAIGRRLRELRTAAGLSQRELADLVGTTPSVICRLESADYDKHSLTMLRRIAAALNYRVKIDFVSPEEAASSA